MNKPAILMFGAGGHASVLADINKTRAVTLTVFAMQSIRQR